MTKKQTKKKSASSASLIAENASARHDYHLGDRIEAGLSLDGWEVKSLRARRAQLKEGYVHIDRGEAYLHGVQISPLPTCSEDKPNPTRTRKLLLHKKEINWLAGARDRKGYTLLPLRLYWKNNRAKLEVGLAKGKQKHDKRADKRDRDWGRDKRRLLKNKQA